MNPPTTAFTAFPAADFEKSLVFYRDILRLPVIDQGEDGLSRYAHFSTGGSAIRVFEWTKPFNHAPHSGMILYVDDVDQWHDYLKEKQVPISGGVRDEPWGGRTMTILDPDGNRFDLLNAEFANSISSASSACD